ncbi:MAG: hypothetical protein ABSE73_32720, partial [Planctomycetota bacterium]
MYYESDWQVIMREHVNNGCCVAHTLRAVNAKYARFGTLSRKTLEGYLKSECGRRQLDEALKAREPGSKAPVCPNRVDLGMIFWYQSALARPSHFASFLRKIETIWPRKSLYINETVAESVCGGDLPP